ncbi:MAG: hypothetical protein KIT62_07730 [Cyclobacteriaceae bacterium]|nr:hypothetical protein [Cyclobacteriaceae bacterium]
MDNFRLNLEQTIIGACLLENGYSRVAGVLTSRNFTQSEYYNHRTIFEAIERLYPMWPIDLITVLHEINKNGYASYLAGCTAKVCSSDNLRYHAFILLQLSMRDVLIHALDKVRSAHISSTTHAAIQEIIDECLDTGNDILEIYPKALSYLETTGAEEFLLADIRKLNEGIDRKIKVIKAQAHIDCLINNLNQLSTEGPDTTTRLTLARLAELIKGILVKGKVNLGTLEALNKIEI